MKHHDTPDEIRRRLLRTIAAVPVVVAVPRLLGLVGCDASGASGATGTTGTAGGTTLDPTLACADDDDVDPTLAETEGPYFTPNSPERTSLLESGIGGTVLVVSGLVLTRSCQPVAGALLDFWQADDAGQYDNAGYRLRGHQFTDARGAYRLETVVPGLYPGRTRHIHVKVQASSQSILTTQLYFPGESRNASDGIFDASLLMQIAGAATGKAGQFNFVLDMA